MLQIIFENENVLAVDKPSGYLSILSRLPHLDMRPCLQTELKKSIGLHLFPLHRLDFEVSGLLLFAKTRQAHALINSWFQDRKINKTYEAFTEGLPPPTSHYQWSHQLIRGKKRAFESPYGKTALTSAHWKNTLLIGGKQIQYWSLTPHTGRSHQLRFQLTLAGYPILGDLLYGAQSTLAMDHAIALRAVSLNFLNCRESKDLGLPEELKVASLTHWIESLPIKSTDNR